MNKFRLRLLYITLGFFILVSSAYVYVSPAELTDYSEMAGVWAHAGRTGEYERNTLEGIGAAFAAGAKGVEIDIFFIPAQSKFVVQHDAPDKVGVANLSLSEIFEKYETGNFWLDFKNLGRLQGEELKESTLYLESLISNGPGKAKVIVESTSARGLSRLNKAGLTTSYWIEKPDDGLGGWRQLFRQRYYLYQEGFNVVSMDVSDYGLPVRIVFGGIPKLLFTINNSKSICRLFEDDNIIIVLSDEPFYTLGPGC